MKPCENNKIPGDDNIVVVKQSSWLDWLSDTFNWFMYKTIKFVPF